MTRNITSPLRIGFYLLKKSLDFPHGLIKLQLRPGSVIAG